MRESLTGQFLAGTRRIEVPRQAPAPERRRARSRAPRQHNLKYVDVDIPLGVLTCVTGVSGSGKSTLVNEILFRAVANRLHRAKMRPGAHRRVTGLDQLDKIIQVDQSPIGRTPRSNPATYIGLFDQIRELFSKTQEARARGYKPGRFSFNVKGGRCEVCRGDGQIKIEMHFLPDVYVPCEQCHGKRYNRETLDIRFKGKTIADVLEMSVEEALALLRAHPQDPPAPPDAARRGAGLHPPGPAGHDAVGRRGAAGQARRGAVQDRHGPDALHPRRAHHRPALRRHPAAARRAAAPRGRPATRVVVIEHNLDVIKTADRIIDMGPEGGEEGGRVMATGTPEQVAGVEASHTGEFLRALVEPKAPARRAARRRKVAAAA